MLQEQDLQHFLDSVPQLAIQPSASPVEASSPQIYLSPLDRSIDRHPLTVPPEMPIAEVLALMNPMRVSCQLCSEKQQGVPNLAKRSCVIVVEDHRPIGIFTERDIVKLTTVVKSAVVKVKIILLNVMKSGTTTTIFECRP